MFIMTVCRNYRQVRSAEDALGFIVSTSGRATYNSSSSENPSIECQSPYCCVGWEGLVHSTTSEAGLCPPGWL